MKAILPTSLLTGVFCAVFTIVVDLLTDALSMNVVIAMAFVSGFCGSLFAQLVLRKGLK